MNAPVKEIMSALKGQLILGDPKKMVQRAVIDSRKIQAGDIFFALKGQQVDGHDYAMSACQQGASAVVVSRMEWLRSQEGLSTAVIKVNDTLEALKLLGGYMRNRFKGKVTGITGSNGKTTTKQMLSKIMEVTGPGLTTGGNYNSQIGLPLVLAELKETDKWMVLEMGASEPGNIMHLCEVARPTYGIITSIGPAHLASFGSLSNIARTKWELPESLPQEGAAIIPWNEPQLESLIRAYTKKIIFFGEDSSCPVRASAIETGATVSFMLHIASESKKVRLPVGGRFNVMNALAAAAAAWVQKISIDQIADALESFEPAAMRMQVVKHASGTTIVNDAYNANPASMLQSVRGLAESYPGKKRVLVLGSMLELGTDSDRHHFHIGSEIGRFELEHVFLLGEETKQMQEGAIAAGMAKKKISHHDNIQEISTALKPFLKDNTVILFKGSRGMKLETVIQNLEK